MSGGEKEDCWLVLEEDGVNLWSMGLMVLSGVAVDCLRDFSRASSELLHVRFNVTGPPDLFLNLSLWTS